MNKEIKEGKEYKQKKLEQPRADEKNVFDKMENEFQKEVENMKLKHRQNKDALSKYL